MGFAGASVAFGQEEEVTVDDVKAEFAGITVAEAEAMGYVEETPCVDASELPAAVLEQLNISATAGMGIHYINGALIDTTLDPLEPEAIQFGPNGDIWNVEYLTPPQDEPLEFLGQQLSYVGEVDLDALHLWVIDNPNGPFADFNPAASCGEAKAAPATGGYLAGGSSGAAIFFALLLGIAGATAALGGWTLRSRTNR